MGHLIEPFNPSSRRVPGPKQIRDAERYYVVLDAPGPKQIGDAERYYVVLDALISDSNNNLIAQIETTVPIYATDEETAAQMTEAAIEISPDCSEWNHVYGRR